MVNEITGRALAYVEYELDYHRHTQFEFVQDGQQVDQWAKSAGVTSALTFLGVDDEDFPSGRAMEIAHTTGSGLGMVYWDTLPNMRDVSALAYLQLVGGTMTPGMGIFLRGNAAGSLSGYFCGFDGTNLFISRYNAGVATVLESIPYPVTSVLQVWLRFDAINEDSGGVLLRAKAWLGEPEDEPDTFTIFNTNSVSPILAEGLSGLLAPTGTGATFRCGYFRARSLFAGRTQTYRHVLPSSFVPKSPVAMPNLVAAGIIPAELSLGESLGKRARVQASFRDHPSSDHGEFYNNGSFWGRMRSKDIFRRGQPLRIIHTLLEREFFDREANAFVEDSTINDIRHFVIDSIDGPTPDGGFVIQAADALKALDNDRAQCPRTTNGYLSAALLAAGTSFDVLPEGIGDLEYPDQGYVAIGGKEIVFFERSGDTFFNLDRGQFNTVAEDHDEEDRVQLVKEFDNVSVVDILTDLLVNFAGIDSSMINDAEWTEEVDTYLGLNYSRVIAEPTGVNKLITELIQQAGLILWHDDVDNKIKLKVLRAVPSVFEYNQRNILKGSLKVTEQPAKRLTEVWTYYGTRNPLESLDEHQNFRSALATIDSEGESIHGEAVIKKIFATWISSNRRGAADRVNSLNLARFATPPRLFTFKVMRYSTAPIPRLGNAYRIRWWANQNELGREQVALVQVTRVAPLADQFEITAEEIFFQSAFDATLERDRVITIDHNVANFDLPEIHNSIYPPINPNDVTGSNAVTLTVVINEGITVFSNDTDDPAFTVGFVGSDWPTGLQITIINNGRIQGAGGRGGDNSSPFSRDGGDGGTALHTRKAITLINNGEIWGGGGGGGWARGGCGGGGCNYGGGGGGAGVAPGAGGTVLPGGPPRSVAGSAGTSEAGGAGGIGNFGGTNPAFGGNGGAPGMPGSAGTSTGFGSGDSEPGGEAGNAVDGHSFVTYSVTGDIRGGQVN